MQSEEDARILEIARTLCRRLNVTGHDPSGVAWLEMVARWTGSTLLHHDQPLLRRGLIILPEEMKGKLGPEEWAPLIASGLIYEKVRRKRLATSLLLIASATALFALALFLVLPLVFSSPVAPLGNQGLPARPEGYEIGILLVAGVVLPGCSLLGIRFLRRGRLQADRSAARILGTSRFLNVLRKIDELDRASDPSDTRSIGAGFLFLPPIEERISNLQAFEGFKEKARQ